MKKSESEGSGAAEDPPCDPGPVPLAGFRGWSPKKLEIMLTSRGKNNPFSGTLCCYTQLEIMCAEFYWSDSLLSTSAALLQYFHKLFHFSSSSSILSNFSTSTALLQYFHKLFHFNSSSSILSLFHTFTNFSTSTALLQYLHKLFHFNSSSSILSQTFPLQQLFFNTSQTFPLQQLFFNTSQTFPLQQLFFNTSQTFPLQQLFFNTFTNFSTPAALLQYFHKLFHLSSSSSILSQTYPLQQLFFNTCTNFRLRLYMGLFWKSFLRSRKITPAVPLLSVTLIHFLSPKFSICLIV